MGWRYVSKSVTLNDHTEVSVMSAAQFNWTLLLVVSQLLVQDFGTLFH